MERVFSFAAQQIGNAVDLGFFARSVKVQTGQNYVVLQQGYTIGPNTVGWAIPLPVPVSTAVFDVIASPSVNQGTNPLGPATQTQTTITYTDEDVPPSPGVLLTPQSIAVIQTGSVVIGPVSQVNIVTGLARAATFFAITQDQSTANWSLLGILGGAILSPTVVSATTVETFTYSVGQGTVVSPPAGPPAVAPPNVGPFTEHMFLQYALECTKPFFFDLRFYY